jgi:hypothetical protein
MVIVDKCNGFENSEITNNTINGIQHNGIESMNNTNIRDSGDVLREGSECEVYLVSGPTGTGDICERNNINYLDKMLQNKLPESCTSITNGNDLGMYSY